MMVLPRRGCLNYLLAISKSCESYVLQYSKASLMTRGVSLIA
jgi:hypothetical protein